MSDAHPPARPHDDEIVAPHGADDHGQDGEHDDHAHAEEPLGPIDLAAWAAGALGVILGLVVAAGLAIATGWIALA